MTESHSDEPENRSSRRYLRNAKEVRKVRKDIDEGTDVAIDDYRDPRRVLPRPNNRQGWVSMLDDKTQKEEIQQQVDAIEPSGFWWRAQCAEFLRSLGFHVGDDSEAVMRGVRGAAVNFAVTHCLEGAQIQARLRKPSVTDRAELARWFVMVLSAFVRRTMVTRALAQSRHRARELEALAAKIRLDLPPEQWTLMHAPEDDPDLLLGHVAAAAMAFGKAAEEG